MRGFDSSLKQLMINQSLKFVEEHPTLSNQKIDLPNFKSSKYPTIKKDGADTWSSWTWKTKPNRTAGKYYITSGWERSCKYKAQEMLGLLLQPIELICQEVTK